MYLNGQIYLGKSEDKKVVLYPQMANRHGLIAGATGTGKTVSLKVLAESFSDAGVPVFLADVKGDLAGMCRPGVDSEDMQERIGRFGLAEDGFAYRSCPTNFWDIYEEKGLPLRTTISEMGPLLLARILDLNETQSSVLKMVFKIADDEGLLLIDTKDLKEMLSLIYENAADLSSRYGNLSKQSLTVIIRAVLALEEEGGDLFFGEPAIDMADWLTVNADGKGTIQILDCQKLIMNPTMYSTFMLWLMSALFERLPEVGDREKPKMIFFFDEAHLLFNNASKNLLEKVEQVVKLIRSRGVGIYFITQNPQDIPDGVLAQLGNKIQHALHAYTPSEMKAVKTAAESFRANPDFDTAEAIQNLGIGEALVSVLDEGGIPTIVERTRILPPHSQMGAISDDARDQEIKGSLLYTRYTDYFDRDSAYEFIQRAKQNALEEAAQEAARIQAEAEELKAQKAAEAEALKAEREAQRAEEKAQREAEREEERARREAEREAARQQKADEAAALKAQKQYERELEAARKKAEAEELKKKKQTQKVIKNTASTAGGTIGREVGKTIGSTMGGSFGKKLGGNLGASLGRGIMSNLFFS